MYDAKFGRAVFNANNAPPPRPNPLGYTPIQMEQQEMARARLKLGCSPQVRLGVASRRVARAIVKLDPRFDEGTHLNLSKHTLVKLNRHNIQTGMRKMPLSGLVKYKLDLSYTSSTKSVVIWAASAEAEIAKWLMSVYGG